jgi:hypothetical protein
VDRCVIVVGRVLFLFDDFIATPLDVLLVVDSTFLKN